MEDPGTDNSDSAPTEAGCNLLCTQLGVNDEVSYLTYAQRVSTTADENIAQCHKPFINFDNMIFQEETCICYPIG